jgi:hypothetical protein
MSMPSLRHRPVKLLLLGGVKHALRRFVTTPSDCSIQIENMWLLRDALVFMLMSVRKRNPVYSLLIIGLGRSLKTTFIVIRFSNVSLENRINFGLSIDRNRSILPVSYLSTLLIHYYDYL